MKILVIGASRGIGLRVVEQALERGHDTTALLRDPGKLPLDRAGLTQLAGVTAGRISRADVADFILNQLEYPTLFGRTPLLTY
jgi:uncharacterized protein YbjT (DUF2867 family)